MDTDKTFDSIIIPDHLVEQTFYTIYLLSAYIRAAADPPPNSS